MASLMCRNCGNSQPPDEDDFCVACGERMPAAPVVAAPVADTVATPAQPVDDDGWARCPFCDEDVPDRGNRVCVHCQRPFPARGARAGSPARGGQAGPDPLGGTRRDAPAGAGVRLTFAADGRDLGAIDVPRDEGVVIGRHPELRSATMLADWDNVSRRHARIGLDGDGAVWVQDEYSTNGTSVNDVPIGAGRRSVLGNGDRIGLGADVVAVVSVREAAG